MQLQVELDKEKAASYLHELGVPKSRADKDNTIV